MIRVWRCGCGRNNMISDRFCEFCGQEIPDKIVNKILIEELFGIHFSEVENWSRKQ